VQTVMGAPIAVAATVHIKPSRSHAEVLQRLYAVAPCVGWGRPRAAPEVG
jgi:hypothetical protein